MSTHRCQPLNSLTLSCMLIVISSVCPCQTQGTSGQALADDLRQHIGNTEFLLRDFSADPVVHLQIKSEKAELSNSRVKAFGLIRVESVSSSGSHITVTGTRRYILRQTPTKLAPLNELEPIVLDIDLQSDIAAITADQLMQAAFFPDVASALAAIPNTLSSFVPGHLGKPTKIPQRKATCDCSQRATEACAPGFRQLGWEAQKLIKSVDPVMPTTNPSGSLQAATAIEVRTDGNVGDVWILRASNKETATAAVVADQRYLFRPGTCHGTPVTTYLEVETNFQKY